MPLVDMRSRVWPHIRANHPAPCGAIHEQAERPATRQRHRMVSPGIGSRSAGTFTFGEVASCTCCRLNALGSRGDRNQPFALPRRLKPRRKRAFLAGCCRVCRKDPVAADPERAPKVLTHDQV